MKGKKTYLASIGLVLLGLITNQMGDAESVAGVLAKLEGAELGLLGGVFAAMRAAIARLQPQIDRIRTMLEGLERLEERVRAIEELRQKGIAVEEHTGDRRLSRPTPEDVAEVGRLAALPDLLRGKRAGATTSLDVDELVEKLSARLERLETRDDSAEEREPAEPRPRPPGETKADKIAGDIADALEGATDDD